MMDIKLRTCVVCRAKKRKEELFRFLVTGGQVVFDSAQKGSGRGFYVCSSECWDRAVKKKRKIKISSRENKFITIPELRFDEATGI